MLNEISEVLADKNDEKKTVFSNIRGIIFGGNSNLSNI